MLKCFTLYLELYTTLRYNRTQTWVVELNKGVCILVPTIFLVLSDWTEKKTQDKIDIIWNAFNQLEDLALRIT